MQNVSGFSIKSIYFICASMFHILLCTLVTSANKCFGKQIFSVIDFKVPVQFASFHSFRIERDLGDLIMKSEYTEGCSIWKTTNI